MKITSVSDLEQHRGYKQALLELLFQLADDDFITAFRGSEWLGLCPHIEEDVAYSSINQNTMGHAAMYYQLLEELGAGDADSLAHARKQEERRNAILLEEVNGEGTYLVEPQFDWAFTVVRNYFYEIAKKVRLDSLQASSYEPLAQVARSVKTEQYYHLKHWEVWFKQLMTSTTEARTRMETQIERVWKDVGGVLTLGPMAADMHQHQLITEESALMNEWLKIIAKMFNQVELALPTDVPGMAQGDGRAGTHTKALVTALATLGEVYHLDPAAAW